MYYFQQHLKELFKYNNLKIDILYNYFSTDLLDNEIKNDSKCAQHIYGLHGFEYWQGWKDHCSFAFTDVYVKDCGIPGIPH